MAIIEDNKSVKFSNGKRCFLVQSTSGNLKIEYKFDKKIYVISRTDGVPFDDDKTEILIFPVFLDRGTSIVVNLPDSIASLSEVSFSLIKRIRNGNISNQNILGFSKK